MLMLAEDDCCHAEAAAILAILQHDLLGLSDTNSRSKVILLGALVVVTGQ